MFRFLKRLIADLFTDATGDTIAIGRVYSLVVLVWGLALPVVYLVRGGQLDFTALGVYVGAVTAAVWALVTGTSKVDFPILPTPSKD